MPEVEPGPAISAVYQSANDSNLRRSTWARHARSVVAVIVFLVVLAAIAASLFFGRDSRVLSGEPPAAEDPARLVGQQRILDDPWREQSLGETGHEHHVELKTSRHLDRSDEDGPHDWREHMFRFTTDDRVFVDVRLRTESPMRAWIDDISVREVGRTAVRPER